MTSAKPRKATGKIGCNGSTTHEGPRRKFSHRLSRGDPATETFYKQQGGPKEHWSTPTPVYAEVLVGVGNLPDGDVEQAIDALAWVDVVDVDRRHSIEAARIADEIGPERPFLDGIDAIVAAVSRDLDGTVVSIDSGLTHPATKTVVDVEAY
ncbi:PIN domain-containing protein [Salinadaptatus halalkaliphilus]|uniref:PIN domain-containing protein n=1 Tax=Salinadaptatus halalkaliphilus TaxID=2419781 RepID=UPI001FEB8590|nr:PIN domain-containing protein [Salinadaptatus halalkaliphilus]